MEAISCFIKIGGNTPTPLGYTSMQKKGNQILNFRVLQPYCFYYSEYI